MFNHVSIMPSKTITIRKDVYDELNQIKMPYESFSELLSRLAKNANGKKLDLFFGKWNVNDEEWSQISKNLEKLRRDSRISEVDLD